MNGKAGRTSSRWDSSSSAASKPGSSRVGDERLEPADVEGLPFDGTGLDHPALGRAERVEAGGQQRVQRRRQRAGLAALAHVGRQLLEEQRIAARSRDHSVERRGRQRRPGVEQPPAGLLVEWGRPQDGAPRPGRSRGEQLGTPDAQQQHGRRHRPAGELLDEVEQSRLRPVRVLEGEHERAAPGERGEEHPEGPRGGVGGGLAAEPERRRDRRRRPAPVLGRRHDRGQRVPAQRLQHHLAQRPVGDAVAVGRAVPDEHLRIGSRAGGELAHEPRLADPGLADEGHQLHPPRVAHPRQRGLQRGELALAPRQRRHVGVARAGRVEQRLHRRAQSQLPRGGLARQPRRRADHLAGGQGIAFGHQRGAGGHPETDVEHQRRLALELGQPALERRRGPDRAQALVLVARPAPEHREQAVRELLDHRVAVALKHRHRRLDAEAHRLLEHLGIQRLAAVAEAHVGRDADHLAPGRQRRLLLRAVEQRGERRRRREAEVVGELAPGDAGGGERLGPAAAELQRPHELEPERFAQRVLGDQRGELAQDALVAAEGEVGLDARAETGEAQLVEAGDLGGGEGLVAQAVQGRAAPQRHRRVQRLRGGGGIAAGQRGLALCRQAREAIRVDRLGAVELQRVAAPVPGDRGGAHRGAQARDDDLQRVGRIGRKPLAPERVDGAVRGDGLTASHEQEAEESQRLTAHGDGPVIEIERFHRPQDPELHVPPLASRRLRACRLSR